VLRVLGKFLDSQEACASEIEERGENMVVSWESGRGAESRLYNELDISDLRQAACLLRGSAVGGPNRERAELLRTLGQELDTQQVQLERLVEEDEGFRVTAIVDGQPFGHLYPVSELRHFSEVRRTMRTIDAVLANPEQFAGDEAELASSSEQTVPSALSGAPSSMETQEMVSTSGGRAPWWRFWQRGSGD